MRIQLIIKYIGNSLLLESLFMAMSAVLSAYNGFDDAFAPMLYSFLITVVVGVFPSIFVRGKSSLTSKEGYLIVALSWIVCCIFGSFPYLFYGIPVTDSLFESISGFTTTGASIINDIESLPQGLLFWRMATAWIGGVGIIALFSLVVSSSEKNKSILTKVEVSEIAMSYSTVRRRSFASKTMVTYVVLTVVAILALKVSGMRWFDAVTHAMSAASTCGFSTRNASIAAFNSPIQEMVILATMVLASVRFDLLGSIFQKRGLSRLFKSEVTRTFFLMLAIGTVLISVSLYRSGTFSSLAQCVREAAFQVAAIFTTTGFATTDTNTWPAMCKSILVVGSLVCGCAGSTSGGIKVDRFLTMLKGSWYRIMRTNNPNLVISFGIDGKMVSDERMSSILSFVFSYVAIILVGSIAFCALGVDMQTSWTASIACVSNVGPGMGSVGSMDNYASMPYVAKWVAVSLMMLGRLEIFPLLSILMVGKRHNANHRVELIKKKRWSATAGR